MIFFFDCYIIANYDDEKDDEDEDYDDDDEGNGDDDVCDSDDHPGALRSDCLWCSHLLHCDLDTFLIHDDAVDQN